MSKYIKNLMTDELRETLGGVRDLLVLDLTGVDAVTDNQMRLKLREKSIRLRVVKNSLARKVFSDSGLGAICHYFDGPTAVAWGEGSVVDLAKEMTEWSEKIEKLQIKGGASDGGAISARDIEALSKLPSREEMLGILVSRVLSPGAQLAGLIVSPGGRLAGQLKARADEGGQP
jgi:large subunit ribosomal protein L10